MIHPSDVSGRFRTRRQLLSGSLLALFVSLPWISISGQPALLLDFVNGRFSVLGLRFWSHDAPLFVFIFGGAAVLLAFVTAVFGRVWCGWACPQTVFIDVVFRRVERWIEGDAVKRRRLEGAGWSQEKLFKRIAKWSAFGAISMVLSHSFLAYFIGVGALARMMAQPPSQNVGSFVAMMAIAALVLFDFGWFREQFCTLVCPYGRFQSVLMDESSLAVAYDQPRGEPRKGIGDCIDCRRCVQVCPTGIDIRNGLQLECIACTACIDACDSVMLKVGKPKGLIAYRPARVRQSIARPAAYFCALAAFATGLTWVVANREPVEMTFVRAVGEPYEELGRPGLEREIVNHFKVDLLNQSGEEARLAIEAQDVADSRGVSVVSQALPIALAPGESKRIDVFVQFPVSRTPHGRGAILLKTRISFEASSASIVKNQEVPLVGPLR